MKKKEYCFYLFLVISVISFLISCNESTSEGNIYEQLKADAKIHTFPLTIVLSNNLSGDNFPADIRDMSTLSKGNCKTLPITGFLRLGFDQYFPYNSISALAIPNTFLEDEAAFTEEVEKQVNDFLSKKRLEDYDSLQTPNHDDWNIKVKSVAYLGNSNDSIFFFSNSANSPSLIQVNKKKYYIYNNINDLRKKVDELICKGPGKISIFYNYPSSDSLGNEIIATTWPIRGTVAGDTCIGHSKYQKLHNGRGGFRPGNLLERNSPACGYTFPLGLAGDTCIGHSKYEKLNDGKGGFRLGNLIEYNSPDCGFILLPIGTPAPGFICDKGSKYQKVHDGKGGFMRGRLIETNSTDCGGGNAPRNIVNNKQADKEKAKMKPTNDCVERSEPLCEQESNGNYTGRRVQYCYDKNGSVIQTIVVSKCDTDCRCIGN